MDASAGLAGILVLAKLGKSLAQQAGVIITSKPLPPYSHIQDGIVPTYSW